MGKPAATDRRCLPSLNHSFTLDLLLGFTGSKGEAEAIKQQLTTYLRDELHLELSAEKTLVTHAREDRARFLGYEVHVLHADDKHDHRGQRCINGSIGLRVPPQVHQAKRARYMRREKPRPLPQRTIDDAYSIVAQYQAEYRGVVQYYRLAYNLPVLSHLKYVTETVKRGSERGRWKSTHQGNSLAAYSTSCVVLRGSREKYPLRQLAGGLPYRTSRS